MTGETPDVFKYLELGLWCELWAEKSSCRKDDDCWFPTCSCRDSYGENMNPEELYVDDCFALLWSCW